jgi:carbon-monoxide dehydrogenase large subunit
MSVESSNLEPKGVQGLGKAIKRKEDPRFIVGKGNYLDDINLPGMLYMALVHSPYAHAKILSIDTSQALKIPGVKAVITSKELAGAGLAWIPTLAGDKQMVLADGKVLFQHQEVAAVYAETRQAAADGAAQVQVEYEPLPVVVDPFQATAENAPVLREDIQGKMSGAHGPRRHNNHIWNWGVGSKDETEKALVHSEVRIKQHMVYPRSHPAPLEPCGCIGDMNKATGRLTVYMTTQAPHAIRTVLSLVTSIPENNIRVISPDIGGGFGNKVPVYPGYVCAIVGSIVLGAPVKWVETRTENLTTTGFARDYHMDIEIGATKDGKVTAMKVYTLADHGAFDAAADPSKYPAGLFSICTGAYDFQKAYAEVDAVYTNKAPGGIAYRCSFRVTEASYLIERSMDVLAHQLKMDPAELRLKNFIQPSQFPYPSALGWTYDSGDYEKTLKVALDKIGYAELRREQAEKRARGELMGIGISTFTEIVGAGPSKDFDILGIKMFDGAEIRVHPSGSAIVRAGTRHQGQGHETTWAQIVSEELGLDVDKIIVEEGDTDTAPYGLGTYASRSTPTAGGAMVLGARRIREKAKKIAAHLLEVGEADLEWTDKKFMVKGVPSRSVTMNEVAFAAYTNLPPGLEPGLETTYYYDPPNLTFPHGAYICVVDIDRGTGQVSVRRFVAIDDCGTIINPMIVEGQIHGGLTEGFAIAFMQEIAFDEQGNHLASNFTDYLLPTSLETPRWETGHTVTPSPHHPIGAKGVGESPTVGSPAAFVNAVVDALAHLGVRHIDMPITREKVWKVLRQAGVDSF